MRPDLMLLVPFVYLVFHLFDAERDRPKPDLSRDFAIPMGPQVGKPLGPVQRYWNGDQLPLAERDTGDECDCPCCTGPEAA